MPVVSIRINITGMGPAIYAARKRSEAMRQVKKPGSGRMMGLLDAGEHMPAGHPSHVLRRRGDIWIQVLPREDNRPHDPQTGDLMPSKTRMAKTTSAASIRNERVREANPNNPRRAKASRTVTTRRKATRKTK